MSAMVRELLAARRQRTQGGNGTTGRALYELFDLPLTTRVSLTLSLAASNMH